VGRIWKHLAAVAIVLLTGTVANAQLVDEGWQSNQNGNTWIGYNVGTWQVNNLAGSGTRCVATDSAGELLPMVVPCDPTGGAASWPIANTRWYCLDGTNGNDSNVGYSDTSEADCGTKALKTMGALNVIFPTYGANRLVVVAVASGTYSSTAASLLGAVGYKTFTFVGTGTNATAGAVAFSGSSQDALYLGAVTAPGTNVGGYNPTAGATTTSLPLTLVGGGSPSFTVDTSTSTLAGYRIRFSSTTATGSLQNFIETIQGVTATNTVILSVALPVTPSTSDVLYIEAPGAVVALPSNFTPQNLIASGMDMATVVSMKNGQLRLGFNRWEFGASFYGSQAIALSTFGKGLRSENSVTDNAGSSLVLDRTYIGGTLTYVQSPERFLDIGSAASNVVVYGRSPEKTQGVIGTLISSAGQPLRILGSITTGGAAAGGVLVIDGDAAFGSVVFPNAFNANGISCTGQCNIRFVGNTGAVTGNVGTGYGIDLSQAVMSTVDTSVIAPTVTGTADILLGGSSGTATWASTSTTGVIDSKGNRVSGGTWPIQRLSSGTYLTDLSGGGTQCVQTDNSGKVTGTGATCGGSGTVTSVTGSNGVICSPSSPNPNCTLANLTCGSNTFVSSASSGSGLVCTQPTIGNLASIPANTLVANPTSASAAPTTVGLGTTSGVMEYVNGSPDTISIFPSGSNRLPFGSGINGQFSDSANLIANGTQISSGQATFDAAAHFVGANDTTPSIITAWDSRHTVFGLSGNQGAGVGFSYTTSTNTENVSFAVPAIAWVNARLNVATFSMYSSGVTLGLYQDAGGNLYDEVLTTNGLMKTTGGTGLHAIATAGTDYAPVGSCSAHQFATATNASSLTCAALGSGDVPCAALPALGNSLSSSAGSCSVKVIALDESGGAHMSINSVPDLGSGYIAVLNRPGGTSTVVGTTASTIADTITKHDFFIYDASIQTALCSGQWAATSSSTFMGAGLVAEVGNDFKATKVSLTYNLIVSIGTASSVDCWVTRNGSLITATDINVTPGTTSPGQILVSNVSTGSTSVSDTYGYECIYNGNAITGPFGAQLGFSVQMVLIP
jgi:hypothetical protein